MWDSVPSVLTEPRDLLGYRAFPPFSMLRQLALLRVCRPVCGSQAGAGCEPTVLPSPGAAGRVFAERSSSVSLLLDGAARGERFTPCELGQRAFPLHASLSFSL